MRTCASAPSWVSSLAISLALVSTSACSGGEKADPKAGGGTAATAEKAAGADATAAEDAKAEGEAAATAATGAPADAKASAASGEGEDQAGEESGTGAAYDRAALEALAPVGVEFCDAYVDAYRKCIIFTVPDGEKAGHAATLMHEHENWARTKAGAAEVAAEALEIGCRSAHAQAAQKTQALNCAWPS
jgi:hypothetical protein